MRTIPIKYANRLLVAGLTAISLCTPLILEAAPKGGGGGTDNRMAISYVTVSDGLNPNDSGWNGASGIDIDLKHLDAQATACGYTQGYEERRMSVKGIHDGTDIFFRYEWNDPTMSDQVNDTNQYGDGVAIQIPIGAEGNRNTVIQMGSQNNPVNILFWRADLVQPQNIVAGGIGTVQTTPDAADQNIVHYQNWSNGKWTVIMGRPMAASTDNQVNFTRGQSYGAVFANWEGGDFERNGHKAISHWIDINIE